MCCLLKAYLQFFLDTLYFSRNSTAYKVKRRTYISRTIGYGISVIALSVTLYSFFSDSISPKDQLYLLIIFIVCFIASLFYDRLNRTVNDLLLSLDKETKDLFYSYSQLEKHEIDKRFKDFFSDFTRYTASVIGVQVYNYNLFPGKLNSRVKLEYEYGSVQEGVDINAVLQNYYTYNRLHIYYLKKAILEMRLNKNPQEAFKLLNILSERIKVKGRDSDLIAIWLLLLNELTINGGVDFDFTEYEKHVLGSKNLRPDKRIGIFQAILYSDILGLKEQYEFGYKGKNLSKDDRLYISLKADSVKGAKKIFLIIVNRSDLYPNEVEAVEYIVSKFEETLNANALVQSSFTINKKEGTLHDAIESIKKV